MGNDIESILDGGGIWPYGNPGKPLHSFQESAGHRFKTILPGLPNRLDVLAPLTSPWQGVALLNFFQQNNLVGVGSGFLCQRDVLVTAGHNLTGAIYDAMGIWMAIDAQSNSNVTPLVPLAYAIHRTLDIAILILPSQRQGAFTLGGALPPAGATVTLAGYALPYADGTVRLSYAAGPLVQAGAENLLSYRINTREGDSGAPVFVTTGNSTRAIGVHTKSGANLQTGNIGVPLNAPAIQDLSTMIDWARAQIGGNQ
ncbi:MAG: serine protease [Aquidulcibacter sp.]|uniref:trypsin-like serine peptidase n=1 Tax=Aquidulcibacter sp. TaxID=2052990 RepID=UPI0022C8C056|nr:serine protease [Aquidulcibacter sp.]